MLNPLLHLAYRVLFVASCIAAALAVWDKAASLFGYKVTLTGPFPPSRLLELAGIALLFVVVLQLREIKASLDAKS